MSSDNHYIVRYTIWNLTEKKHLVLHKKFMFNSDLDLLGALDYATTKLYDEHKGLEILFKTIELSNAQEVYDRLINEKTHDIR